MADIYNYKISIQCFGCDRIEDMFLDLESGKTATIQCKDCRAWKCDWVVDEHLNPHGVGIWFSEPGVFKVFIR